MTKLQKQIPASVNMTLMYDRAATIRESVRDVKFTLVLTLFLVIAVIFLFLRNVSATVIPSLALPISVIGTFAVMYLLDYSLDNLSLMALTLAVGFVVDDAIVMLENIVRHMEMGKPPMKAAIDGAAEVGFTILSMTISLTAVFIPILFLGGIVGRLFHEFAVVIAVSILVSGFVSLTLTPMLSSRFLRPHAHDEKHGRAYQVTEAGYEWLLARYKGSLEWVMNHRATDDGVLVRDSRRHGRVVHVDPEGLHPEPGQRPALRHDGDGAGHVVRRHGDAPEAGERDIVAADTNIAGFYSAVGGSSTVSGTNQGRLLIGLKPRDKRLERRRHHQGAAAEAGEDSRHRRVHAESAADSDRRTRVEEPVSVHDAELRHRDAVSGGGRSSWREARKSPLLQDVTSDLQLGNPQASVEIDRERAASLGVTAEQIETALYDAYGSRQVSTIYTPNDEYWVVMELLPQYQLDLSAMNLLYVRSKSGTLVPLSAVAHDHADARAR